jgi:hypothetical protein
VERRVKPRRIDSITRISLAILSGFFDWRDVLVVVRLHAQGSLPAISS